MNKIIKGTTFYISLLVAMTVLLIKMPSIIAISFFIIAVSVLIYVSSKMTEEEFYSITAANFFNRLFHTDEFTKE